MDLLESLGLNEETTSETASKTEEKPIVEESSETEILEEPVNKPEHEETFQQEIEPEPELESDGFMESVEDEKNTEMEENSEFENEETINEGSERELTDDEYLDQSAFEELAEAETELELELEPETPDVEISEKPQPSDSVSSMIDEWENKEPEPKKKIQYDQKLMSSMKRCRQKIEALREKKEEFRELNLEAELGIISAENEVIYNQMKIELKELEEEIELLKHERRAIDADMFTSPEGPYVSDGFFEVPDDFEEQKYRPMDRPHEEPTDLASRIARMVTRTTERVSDKVANDFDWKKMNPKFYGTAKTHFSHQFTFEDIDAKTIDIKLAKGKVILKTWEDETINDIKVEATVALLGNMDEPDPIDAFLERSHIDINNYQILFMYQINGLTPN